MFMKKNDWILIICLLCAAGLFALITRGGQKKEMLYISAKVDGTEIGRWSIHEDGEMNIDTDYGHNRIRVSGNTVQMIEADCPDGYCKTQEKIGLSGGSIICLPHHLVVEMVQESGEKKNESDVDTIAG